MQTKYVFKYDEAVLDTGVNVEQTETPAPEGNTTTTTDNALTEGQPKWLAAVSPKYREGLTDVESVNVMAERYFEGRMALDNYKDAIMPLGENATEEEIKSYMGKIGVPSSADDYPDLDITLPEGFKLDVQALKDEALLGGIRKDSFAKFMKIRVESALSQYATEQDVMKKAQDEALTKSKEKYGEKYDAVKLKA